ncbi:hypothetical protein SAMN06295912_102182 [Sphingomonas laterariae]|uniref:Uncharacterized protein n=1 Tax=Edaphosphingomonas laterariae TaxID=861865 RepID=A0A239CGU1_9SPHN|nr:GldG family protein [Sphingomonas laterariae]SNS18911.1 hypothetical protein SAMN06295912_102182 [Sphingomonas laterariae]
MACAGAVAIAAACLALAEILGGLALGLIAGHGRADLFPFVAVRPWLFLILMMALAGWPPRARLAAALLGLVTASAGEAAWLGWHGGWSGDGALGPIARAGAAGLLMIAVMEAVLRGAAWAGGRHWRWLAAAIGLGVLLSPGMVAWVERAALGSGEAPARSARPPVQLLSGLPLVWSEAGVAATLAGGRAPATMERLGRHFTIRPIATADALAPQGLALIAQPRADAHDLVAIDRWVRAGGRALILTDPDLRWPTQLPPGDPGLPPDAAPLAPLIAHWGLRLVPDRAAMLAIREVMVGGMHYHIRPGAPGRLSGEGAACAILADGLAADCAIGAGRALVVADADWLLDDLWVGMGSHGTDRFRRLADNGAWAVALLDDLAGLGPRHPADAVLWIESDSAWQAGWLVALCPALALLAGGLIGRRRCNNAPVVPNISQTYPQAANKHKGGTGTDFRHTDR